MRNALVAALVAISVACQAHYPTPASPTASLAAIRIFYAGPHQWVNPGNSLTLFLYAIDTDGVYQPIAGSNASWFSSNASVASVTNGTGRAVTGGVADIVATYQGFTSTARIVVLNPNAVQYPWFDIRPYSIPEIGKSVRATAIVFTSSSSGGGDVGPQATWTSSDPGVLKVEAGMITSVGPGTASVTAAFNGMIATSYASVQPLRRLP